MTIFKSHVGLFLQALDVKENEVQAKSKAACRHNWARWRDGHALVERYYATVILTKLRYMTQRKTRQDKTKKGQGVWVTSCEFNEHTQPGWHNDRPYDARELGRGIVHTCRYTFRDTASSLYITHMLELHGT